MNSNKVKGIILGVLGNLQKNISFDEYPNKTYYDGVKRGIKLSKIAIENISKETLGSGCEGCAHLADEKYRCDLCSRFGHQDLYLSKITPKGKNHE